MTENNEKIERSGDCYNCKHFRLTATGSACDLELSTKPLGYIRKSGCSLWESIGNLRFIF